MKKRIVAVVLAGTMIASQLWGAAETLAADMPGDDKVIVSDIPENAFEGGAGGSGVLSDASGDLEVQAKAELKAIFLSSGDVVERDASNQPQGTKIPEDKYNTVTDLLVDSLVQSIPANMFSGMSNLTKLVFANASTGNANTRLTLIGAGAFKGTSIAEVTLPAALTTIGNAAFQGTTALKNVDFSASTRVTSIGANAFERSGITKVTLPTALTTIGASAFKSTSSLKNVDFSNATRITSIGESAFEGSGLTGALGLSAITLNRVDIGDKAFMDNAGLTSVTLPEKMITLKAKVFQGTGLKTIQINKDCTVVVPTALPNTLTSITVATGNTSFAIEGGALYNTAKSILWAYPGGKAGDVTFPATLTSIGSNAFENNTTITKVTIPATLTNIGQEAFKGNTSLREVEFAGSPELTDIEAAAFWGTTALKVLDLRNVKKIATMGDNVFKGGALESLHIGEQTKKFTLGTNTFETTAISRKVHFLDDKGGYISGSKLTTLMNTWQELKESAKGAWVFYTQLPTPAAVLDYDTMKLKGLEASASYKIEVDGENVPEMLNADTNGMIDLKKGWGGRNIRIRRPATDVNAESLPQEFSIQDIYTVMVDGAIHKNSVAGKNILVTAPHKNEYVFTGWKTVGVTFPDPSQKAVTFIMPANDVTLTTTYKKIVGIPTAKADYATMKLTSLVPNAAYEIASQDMTADGEGTIPIKKEWSDKDITIVKKETQEDAASPAQTLKIKPIFSITVDGDIRISVEGQTITIEASTPEGYRFKEWKATGVTLNDTTKETISFTMPASDVTLTPSYMKVMTTNPEEMEYDGQKEISVKFEVPLAEFTGIEVDGKMLQKGKDYLVAESVRVAAFSSGSTVVTFTKTYLNSLKLGTKTFKAVFKSGPVDFSIKVTSKPAIVFPDVKENDWFYHAVNYVSSNQLMTGYASGGFGPSDILGRGQFATILYRMAGSAPTDYKNVFSDVPPGTFYSLPVVWGRNNDIITGYESGLFGYSDSITREQLVTIMYRYATKTGVNVFERGDLSRFSDAGNVSSFARESMSWAVGAGIISGDQGKLNPQGTSSRAVAAAVIQRFHKRR